MLLRCEKKFTFRIFTALTDAAMCSVNNLKDSDATLREMWRVLKPDGTYLIVSHAPPERRLPHFNRSLPGIGVEVKRIRKCFFLFERVKFYLFIVSADGLNM